MNDNPLHIWQTDTREGVGLREYFAAHAPAVPEIWFDSVVEFEPLPAPPGLKWCPACMAGGECETPEICSQLNNWNAEVKRAKQRNAARKQKATTAQWPWAWADAVLRERGQQ